MPVRLAAALVVLGALPALAQPGLPSSPLDDRHQYVATLVTGEIEAFTGVGARNCGIYTLRGGPDSRPAAGRPELMRALRCVQDAQRQARGAWALWQVAGVDAIVFDGLAASAVSAVHRVETAGNAGGLRLEPCRRPRVTDEATVGCENLDRAPDARRAPRALEGLDRDLRRTTRLSRQALADARTWAAASPGSTPPAADAADPVVVAVREAQRAVEHAGQPAWPRCPRHFDHALTVRDDWWYCERESAFIAALGRLSRVVRRPPP